MSFSALLVNRALDVATVLIAASIQLSLLLLLFDDKLRSLEEHFSMLTSVFHPRRPLMCWMSQIFTLVTTFGLIFLVHSVGIYCEFF